MNALTINWLAVVVAALSAFALGGLWYSPLLFEKPWRRSTGVSEQDLAARSMPKVFGLSFLWSLVMAVNLAFFLDAPDTTALWGLSAGLRAGLGWVAMGFFIVGLFEARGLAWMLINGGYLTLSLALMGLILGAWR